MATFSTIESLDMQNSNVEENSCSVISVKPDYDTFQRLIAFGKEGSKAGELNYPQGIAIHEGTGHIYVADWSNNRIQIFSETCDFIKQFGNQELCNPCGILINANSVYVSDYGHSCLFLFSIPDLTMLKRVGGEGCGDENFHSPAQLSLSPQQQLYVADSNNDRLQILNVDLAFQGTLQHPTMTCPFDVKFSKNQMFVLSRDDDPRIHIFTLTGEKIQSIISRENDADVEMAFFFCLDAHDNIIISDYGAHDIKIFSQDGELLHIIGEHGHSPGKFYHPTGIAILNQSKLVSVSDNFYTDLQIFSAY